MNTDKWNEVIERINTWLNSGMEFFVGVAIYKEFGTSKNEMRLFDKGGNSRRNRELLEYELRKLLKSNIAPRQSTSVPVIRRPIPVPGSDAKIPKPVFEPKVEHTGRRPLEDEAKILFEEIRMKLKVRDNLHATLEYIPTDEIRLGNALKILDISDEIAEGYDQLRHYDQHGILPPPPKKEERKKVSKMDIAEMMTRRQTLRTYISRYTRLRDDSEDTVIRSRNQEILDKYKIELDEIDNALKK
jgi:hypothetical protein